MLEFAEHAVHQAKKCQDKANIMFNVFVEAEKEKTSLDDLDARSEATGLILA